MKNLFERMTAENKEKFYIALKEYPSTMDKVYKDLCLNYWVIDLKFSTAIDLNFYVLSGSFDIAKVFNAFEKI